LGNITLYMEITSDTYSWLLSIGALTETDITFKDEEKAILGEEVAGKMKSGLKVSEIVRQLYYLKVHYTHSIEPI